MPINWFANISELLSLVPTKIGIGLRRLWYKRMLRRCGEHLTVEHLACIRSRDVECGDWCTFGRNNWIGQCSFGSHVICSNNITFLSGMHQHETSRHEIPMVFRKGNLEHIKVGSDVWIGTGAVIGADIADGTIVAAGAVVNRSFPPHSIIGGVPARLIGERK